MSKNVKITKEICFLRSLLKYLRKYQYRKRTFFFRSLLKIVFCQYLRKIFWRFRGNDVTLRSFCPISPNISKFKENVLFFIFHWKIVFCYVRKYQHFEENKHFTLKNLFFAHISENMNISRKGTFFLRSLWNPVFWPYLRKYQHFDKSGSYFEIYMIISAFPKKDVLLRSL